MIHTLFNIMCFATGFFKKRHLKYIKQEMPNIKTKFEKQRGILIQIYVGHWTIQKNFKENQVCALLITLQSLTMMMTRNICGSFCKKLVYTNMCMQNRMVSHR